MKAAKNIDASCGTDAENQMRPRQPKTALRPSAVRLFSVVAAALSGCWAGPSTAADPASVPHAPATIVPGPPVPAAALHSTAADLCVVPVVDSGTPTPIEASQAYRLLTGGRTFPGSPLAVLHPLNRSGVWTLTADRRYVRLTDEAGRDPAFPAAAWTNSYVLEEHSGRVLGTRDARGVWALAPSADRFIRLRPEQWEEVGFLRQDAIAYVPAWKATLLGGAHGLFMVRDDGPIVPVPDAAGGALGDVTRVRAVPGPEGAAVLGTLDGRVLLVSGAADPERTQLLFAHPKSPHSGQGSDSFWAVTPLAGERRFLLRSIQSAHLLTLSTDPQGGGAMRGTTVEVENGFRALDAGVAPARVLTPDGEYLLPPARAS